MNYPRAVHTCTLLNDKVFVFGSNLNTGSAFVFAIEDQEILPHEKYIISENKWVVGKSNKLYRYMSNVKVVPCQGTILMNHGILETNKTQVYQFDPITEEWLERNEVFDIPHHHNALLAFTC